MNKLVNWDKAEIPVGHQTPDPMWVITQCPSLQFLQSIFHLLGEAHVEQGVQSFSAKLLLSSVISAYAPATTLHGQHEFHLIEAN